MVESRIALKDGPNPIDVAYLDIGLRWACLINMRISECINPLLYMMGSQELRTKTKELFFGKKKKECKTLQTVSI